METRKMFGGLLAGVAIGVAIGILLAPTSGVKMQKEILKGSRRLAGDLKSKLGDSIDSMRRQYNGAVDDTAKKGKEVIAQVSDRIKV